WRYGKEAAKSHFSRLKLEMHENGESELKIPKLRFNEYVTGTNRYNREVVVDAKTGFHCPDCGGPLYEKKDVLASERFFEQRSGRNWNNRIKKDTNYVCTNTVKTKYLPKSRVIDSSKEEQECG